MRQVWKFDVDPNENPTQMPEGAEIISAGFQSGGLQIWALVDVGARLVPRKLIVRGTGHNIRSTDLVFIQTVFMDSLVFHVFEDLS